MQVWSQQTQSLLMMNQMALTYNLISERMGLQNNSQPEHRLLFESPQMLTSHNISRPNSSCSLNSNGSLGEVRSVLPIHNRNFQESRYKTELCRHYEESGDCPHGQQCLYAHGQQELVPFRGRHRKFKTQLCKAFHCEGFCSFGPRCSYIHSKPNPEAILTSIQAIIPFTPDNQFHGLTHNFIPNKVYQNNSCRLSVFTKICENS